MKLNRRLVVFSVFLVFVTVRAKVNNFSDDLENNYEEYDEKLSSFIQEILENFREQMPEGLPEIGIPPIDPLSISDVEKDIDNNIARIALRMKDINVTGISQFELKELKADLQKGFANFSIYLPELKVEGDCWMNGKVIDIFPINSDGPFDIIFKKVHIKGRGELNVTTEGNTRIHMDSLKLHLKFESMSIVFKSLLGGARWTQLLVELLSNIGPRLFLQFHEQAMTLLSQSLLTLINNELDKGTLSDLLDQIPLAAVASKMLFGG